MGVGYIFGCLFSIILWRVDRHNIFYKMNVFIRKRLQNKVALQLFYSVLIIAISYLVITSKKGEFQNFLVAFFVIEISNSERKTIFGKAVDKKHFYDTLSVISKALVCGFIAPLLYIVLFGNIGGVVYTLVYYISYDSTLILYNYLIKIFNALPSLIAAFILYLIYIPRNKTFKIDFKGDFITNIFYEPLLNIYILSAYIESVNFYHHFEKKKVHYLTSYGVYTNKIDEGAIKDFLSLIYGVSFVIFISFWAYEAYIIKLASNT